MASLEVHHTKLHIPAHMDLQPWHELTISRKMKILQGEDILRWGHSSRGTFTIKEAYDIKTTFHLLPQEQSLGENMEDKALAKN
jgi:hypothetical protein